MMNILYCSGPIDQDQVILCSKYTVTGIITLKEKWQKMFLSFFTIAVSACSGSIDVWASLVIGVIIGLISSVISWSVKKCQPSWTSTGSHDVMYCHGIPGILGAVTGEK